MGSFLPKHSSSWIAKGLIIELCASLTIFSPSLRKLSMAVRATITILLSSTDNKLHNGVNISKDAKYLKKWMNEWMNEWVK